MTSGLDPAPSDLQMLAVLANIAPLLIVAVPTAALAIIVRLRNRPTT